MPLCGSQLILCDLPIRFDTYVGCSHACKYCFVQAKKDIQNIKKGESSVTLMNFIKGNRNEDTNWCDWNIPLHWGGTSDPFQPLEATYKSSYKCLQVFAETKYPFVVSTKGKLIAEPAYLELLRECNCVIQISLVSPQFDKIETGAPTFNERIEMVKKLATTGKRIIIRVQPYVLEVKNDILRQIEQYQDIGVYGITIEGIKYKRKYKNLIRICGDFCYPFELLKSDFLQIKDKCHIHGLKFYSAENRLRSFGDSLCCCGIDGLTGFKPNTYNLNHFLFDKENFIPTQSMQQIGTSRVYSAINQNSLAVQVFRKNSMKVIMDICSKDKAMINALLPK